MANPAVNIGRRIDTWQQRHGGPAVVVGVIKKYGDDRGGTLAGVLTFYGFVSLFPLLLLGLTVVAFVAGPGSHAYGDFRSGALRDFPVVGNQLPSRGLSKSGLGLVVGAVGLLWGSLGVAQAVQFAINEAWGVPPGKRHGFLPRTARGLAFFAVLGASLAVSQILSLLGTIVGGSSYLAGALGVLGGALVNVGLFLAVFKVLAPFELTWRDHLPGAVMAGVGWEALQLLGGVLVRRDVRNMTPAYGQFAVVLGLISFLSLASQLVMYSVETNVVLKQRLWPQAFMGTPTVTADEA
jgi:uncharacterized BrkB/YihY/UPF0761 family membrane protein